MTDALTLAPDFRRHPKNVIFLLFPFLKALPGGNRPSPSGLQAVPGSLDSGAPLGRQTLASSPCRTGKMATIPVSIRRAIAPFPSLGARAKEDNLAETPIRLG